MATLRQVTGVEDLSINQRRQLWSSNEPYDHPLAPEVIEHKLDQGDELAVAIAIAVDPTDDVLEFLRMTKVPAQRLLVLRSPAGSRDNSVPDAATAVALATGIRDVVRKASRRTPHIHLFLAGPMGLAVLLGHRWNRIRPTTIYEDVQTDLMYEAAFTINA